MWYMSLAQWLLVMQILKPAVHSISRTPRMRVLTVSRCPLGSSAPPFRNLFLSTVVACLPCMLSLEYHCLTIQQQCWMQFWLKLNYNFKNLWIVTWLLGVVTCNSSNHVETVCFKISLLCNEVNMTENMFLYGSDLAVYRLSLPSSYVFLFLTVNH